MTTSRRLFLPCLPRSPQPQMEKFFGHDMIIFKILVYVYVYSNTFE